jgi:hypothetical protein
MVWVHWLFNSFGLLFHRFSVNRGLINHRLGGMLFLCCMLIAFSSCENTAGTSKTGTSLPYTGPFSVTFAPSIAYKDALRLITDLGLQPSLECVINVTMLTQGPGPGSDPQSQWQPMGQRDSFIHTHLLRVITTLSSPLDWSKRLETNPGVVKVDYPGVIYCPAVVYGTPSPEVAVPLNAGQSGDFARITFTRSMNDYDTALYAVSNLGLQLADPCYEHAKSQGTETLTPSWHPMGQEHTFLTTHSLIVETTKAVTSSLWQTQLRTFPGVVSIETPYTVKC